jgi:phosphoadenosine phosphosulfate reductase
MVHGDLFGYDKVAVAIERLRTFEPPDGYFLAYGGGKDSTVLLELARRSGVKFEAHYHNVTIEPPELVQFVRQVPGVIVDRPAKSFFQLLPQKGFPLRQRRWCCQALKEGGGAGRVVLLGVRWEESIRRRDRKMVEAPAPNCPIGRRKTCVSPIIDWTSDDIWQFIKSEKLLYCRLYDEGFKRLGCIACPMQSADQRRMGLARWPKFEPAFRLAFRRLFENRMAAGTWNVKQWPSGDACFDWWLSNTTAQPKAQEWFDYD